MGKIPEINIILKEMMVKGGDVVFTNKSFYDRTNLFGKLKMIWRWYWTESETKPWLAYLNTRIKIKWEPELAQDLNVFHNPDAESELIQLLEKEIIDG